MILEPNQHRSKQEYIIRTCREKLFGIKERISDLTGLDL